MIDIYSPRKLRDVISFSQMCYPLYQHGVLKNIMGYELMLFIIQAEILIVAERLNTFVCCYESSIS